MRVAGALACVAVGMTALLCCVGDQPETGADPADAGAGAEASAESGPAVDAGEDAVTPDGGDAGVTYEQAVNADDPALYLRLGESKTSPTVADAQGNAFGVKPGITLGVGGALQGDANTAAGFDGTGHIDLAQAFKVTPAKGLTLEAWIKPDNVMDAFRYLIAKSAGASGRAGVCLRINPDGKLAFQAGASDSDFKPVSSSQPLVVGAFTHVVATMAGSNATLYVNSAPDASSDFLTTRPINTTTPLVIGAIDFNGVPQLFFDGVIDEVAIYDKALSAARVKAHYEAGKKQ